MERRAENYRRELNGLNDAQWRFAVEEAIRNERWFPPIATLLDYSTAAGAPLSPVAGYLEAPVVNREEQAAIARAGVAKIREVLLAQGINVNAGPTIVVRDKRSSMERIDAIMAGERLPGEDA